MFKKVIDDPWPSSPKWTLFWDMHSGGRRKLIWEKIYIQLPYHEAIDYFKKNFGRDPNNVTCHCCGQDYSIDSHNSIEEASVYHRKCIVIYPDGYPARSDFDARRNYSGLEPRYLDGDGLSGEPIPNGWHHRESCLRPVYISLQEYMDSDDILVLCHVDWGNIFSGFDLLNGLE